MLTYSHNKALGTAVKGSGQQASWSWCPGRAGGMQAD